MNCALCAGNRTSTSTAYNTFYESRDGEKDDYLRTLGETGAALVGEYGEVLILRKKDGGRRV